MPKSRPYISALQAPPLGDGGERGREREEPVNLVSYHVTQHFTLSPPSLIFSQTALLDIIVFNNLSILFFFLLGAPPPDPRFGHGALASAVMSHQVFFSSRMKRHENREQVTLADLET